MRVDGKFLTVNGKSNFDGTFTAVTQHDGKLLAVDGFPFFYGNFMAVDGKANFDGKSPLYRDRPPVRYIYVGKITEHLPGKFGGSHAWVWKGCGVVCVWGVENNNLFCRS